MTLPRRLLRVLIGSLLATLLALAGLGATSTPAEALSKKATKAAQTTLAGLGYLGYHEASGRLDARTRKAVRSFQADRCLDTTGKLNKRTRAQLSTVTKSVQGKLRVTRSGRADARTRKAVADWQRRHRLAADGRATKATMAKLKVKRSRACGTRVNGDIHRGSAGVKCAKGTRNLGVHSGYAKGKRIKIRLCAIPGFRSSSGESTKGSSYYVKGAKGDVVVNSRVSGSVLGIYRTARNSGRTLRANSSFRTMAHQKALCRANAACRGGDGTFVARPGHSNHQLGVAVDYAGTGATGGKKCSKRAKDPGSGTWRFLTRNAPRFGMRQYAPESWHWDAMGGSGRC